MSSRSLPATTSQSYASRSLICPWSRGEEGFRHVDRPCRIGTKKPLNEPSGFFRHHVLKLIVSRSSLDAVSRPVLRHCLLDEILGRCRRETLIQVCHGYLDFKRCSGASRP